MAIGVCHIGTFTVGFRLFLSMYALSDPQKIANTEGTMQELVCQNQVFD